MDWLHSKIIWIIKTLDGLVSIAWMSVGLCINEWVIEYTVYKNKVSNVKERDRERRAVWLSLTNEWVNWVIRPKKYSKAYVIRQMNDWVGQMIQVNQLVREWVKTSE